MTFVLKAHKASVHIFVVFTFCCKVDLHLWNYYNRCAQLYFTYSPSFLFFSSAISV